MSTPAAVDGAGVEVAGAAALPVAALRRLVASVEEGACDLCGQVLPEPHDHVADVSERALRCACPTCAGTLRPDGDHRRVPDTARQLPPAVAEEVWDGLGAPVGVVFLVRGDDGGWTASYPGAAGAVTAVLDEAQVLASVAGLATDHQPRPEVEALLLDRRRGRPPAAWVVGVDTCYGLSARLRSAWQGIDGGPDADAVVADVLADLHRRHVAAALAPARAVADAVLHEGEVLYPFRADSPKNRWRWTFGIVWPRPWAAHPDAEPWWATATFLVRADDDAEVTVQVRHQHLERRERPGAPEGEDDWDEARVLDHTCTVRLSRLRDGHELAIDVPGGATTTRLADGSAERRTREPLAAVARLRARQVVGWHLLEVRIENLASHLGGPAPEGRADAVRHALVGTQVAVAVPDGQVGSLRAPDPGALAAVAQAVNERLWPVVVDEHVALATPMVLPEPPRLAPGSTGEIGDGLEIEEMMALRVRTLLPDEKAAATRTDPFAADVVARLDGLDPAGLLDLHAEGATTPGRGTVGVAGRVLGVGSRVRLRPRRRADAMDLALDGRTATVDAVLEDLDGQTLLRVTVDGDPGADLQRATGRGFHFAPDEVEPLADVLVAGVGNVFRRDDGFGPAVIRALRERGGVPAGVRLEDYGIRGVHLAWDLASFEGRVVVIDAIDLDAAPGTVVLLQPDQVPDAGPVDGHDLRLPAVLARARDLASDEEAAAPAPTSGPDVIVLGCVPGDLDEGMGLSDAVAAAVGPAVDRLLALLVEDH